jgi:hypothetical protein
MPVYLKQAAWATSAPASVRRLTRAGTRAVAPSVAAISRAEHFEGHALTAEVRLR